jgi:hypothetical protein
MQKDLLYMIDDHDQCTKFGENLGTLVLCIEGMLGRQIRTFRIDAHGIGWDVQSPVNEKDPMKLAEIEIERIASSLAVTGEAREFIAAIRRTTANVNLHKESEVRNFFKIFKEGIEYGKCFGKVKTETKNP